MSQSEVRKLQHMLVVANHILHYHQVVDGFGHVSVRHPGRPNVYVMCGYMPPALVESADDLIEYYVDGSDPVDPDAKKGYSERFIHGEMFKRYPDIQCVVHSHAEVVAPYTISSVPLVSLLHMSGFLGGSVPVWDITPLYNDDYQQDMLVNNAHFGSSLAAAFCSTEQTQTPEHTVVLMKRHGFTTFGKDIPTAVYRAIYTMVNASVQTNAALLQRAAIPQEVAVQPLSLRQADDCRNMTEATQDKAWRLWVREVEASPLYRNVV